MSLFPRVLQMLKSVHVNDVVLSGNFTVGSAGAVSARPSTSAAPCSPRHCPRP